jgi:hypothetical protein
MYLGKTFGKFIYVNMPTLDCNSLVWFVNKKINEKITTLVK